MLQYCNIAKLQLPRDAQLLMFVYQIKKILKQLLQKLICRMCDDDEWLNARAQGSTLQSLFVAPPPASIWFNQTFCLLCATRLIWAPHTFYALLRLVISGGAHMQRNPTQIQIASQLCQPMCNIWSSCICVFVYLYLYLYLCVCICICTHATQPCANSGWLTIMPMAAAQHVEPNLSHILQSAEHANNVEQCTFILLHIIIMRGCGVSWSGQSIVWLGTTWALI